jgi:hypothetical protein
VPVGYDRANVATSVYSDPRPGHLDSRSYAGSAREPKGTTPGVSFMRRVRVRHCPHLVRVMYRRGFDTFTVTVQPRTDEKPVEQVRAGRKGSKDVKLTGGFLAGATARIWISALDYTYQFRGGGVQVEGSEGPTLLAYKDKWRVDVSGGLTEQELIDVANSLQVYGEAF